MKQKVYEYGDIGDVMMMLTKEERIAFRKYLVECIDKSLTSDKKKKAC